MQSADGSGYLLLIFIAFSRFGAGPSLPLPTTVFVVQVLHRSTKAGCHCKSVSGAERQTGRAGSNLCLADSLTFLRLRDGIPWSKRLSGSQYSATAAEQINAASFTTPTTSFYSSLFIPI